jgi:hypothetical protein
LTKLHGGNIVRSYWILLNLEINPCSLTRESMALGNCQRMLAGIPANIPFGIIFIAENVCVSTGWVKASLLGIDNFKPWLEDYRNSGENGVILKREKMKKSILILAVFFAFITIIGCGLVESRVARFSTDFKVLASDDRILYEKGAEALAEETARHLSQATKTVESRQFGTFKEPIKIYAFADTKSFAKFANVPEVVKGASTRNEVYLSGQLLKKMGEVQGILTHELSHVQLLQTLGTVTFNRTLPRWFREGLAIYVADGGGATNATEKETIEQFLQGNHFAPKTEGALFNFNLPGSKGLEPKIFYRQSGMFVQFMARNHSKRFEALVKSLQEGKNFKAQFAECFKCNVSAMLQAFIGTLRRT